MPKPYDLLEDILNEIENNLKEYINADNLADKYNLSSTHLRRLFKFAFGQSIGTYIRSRKLTASIEGLLHTDMNVLEIALEYGIDYEQSYIRTFKREFGLTPGEFRKTGKIVKIKPPIQLFNTNRMADDIFFGPDIVMVPQFHIIGKKYKLPYSDEVKLSTVFFHNFYDELIEKIPNKLNSDVRIVLNMKADEASDASAADYSLFIPAVQVKSLDNVPEDFDCFTIPSSLHMKFRFIGPDNTELDLVVAKDMMEAINKFVDENNQNYYMKPNKINFSIMDPSVYGNYKLWEWFSPVINKAVRQENN